MKNNIDYFIHHTGASTHPKFKLLRSKYGWGGQAKFWCLNEIIGKAEDCWLEIDKKFIKADVADCLDFSLEELDQFIKFLSEECELIITCDQGFISTDIVQEVLKKCNKERYRSRKRRGAGSTKGRPKSDRVQKENDRGQISQTKLNETKRKKYGDKVKLSDEEYTKLKDSLGDVEPWIEKCNDYCVTHGKSYKSYYRAILSYAKRDDSCFNVKEYKSWNKTKLDKYIDQIGWEKISKDMQEYYIKL